MYARRDARDRVSIAHATLFVDADVLLIAAMAIFGLLASLIAAVNFPDFATALIANVSN